MLFAKLVIVGWSALVLVRLGGIIAKWGDSETETLGWLQFGTGLGVIAMLAGVAYSIGWWF